MPGVPQKPYSPEKERHAQLCAFYPSTIGGDDLWHPCNWDPATGNLIVTADFQASSITIGAIKLEDRASTLKTNVLLEGAVTLPPSTPASGIPIIIKDLTSGKYQLVSARQLSDALVNADLGIITYSKISNFPSDFPDSGSITALTDILDELQAGIVVKNHPTENLVFEDENLAVPRNTETSILSSTNSGTTYWLDTVLGSGNYNGEYTFYRNGALVFKRRTTASAIDMVHSFFFPLLIANADIIELKVKHYAPSGTREFNASFIGSR